MALSQATVGTGNTTIFTSSGNNATTAMFFMNDNASARTIDLYLVPSGGSAGTTTQILKTFSIDGADTYIINDEKIVLANGDTIVAKASASSSIYATVSYVSI